MSALPRLASDEFGAFFHAVHGHHPFPWQERLARTVAESGWPGVLDLPTGTGKTAALDIAVFALALDADRDNRRAPLRIIYVVDRRTIVDQAYERAGAIERALTDGGADVLDRVRARLASYSREHLPLRRALLRGGVARNDLWARAPDQPLVVVSTVDQVGSRLLFRGYGVSDSMKPIHAGLLGCDALYLLDEVHVSQPFRETLVSIRDRYRAWAEQPLSCPFEAVEMSATPGGVSTRAFGLDDADRTDPRLSVRLNASKPVTLVSTTPAGFVREIEKHALSMLDRPAATVAVVVNRVKSAREIHRRLRQVVPEAEKRVHLLTGRMRPVDREALEREVLPRIRAGRTRRDTDGPAIVVATQSIEVGADFDFDGLVTECAGLDALRQRFGRLDRLGALAGAARGVIVIRSDSASDDPVYGDAIGRTWDWLKAYGTGYSVDFGIHKMAVPDNARDLGLLAPAAHAPVLLPSHLDAWVQTSPIPEPDPDVALWLHGPHTAPADVQIVWRADLTPELMTRAGAHGGAKAAEVAMGIVDALPPVGAEAMPVPFVAARRWLERGPEPESFDVEGAVVKEEADRERDSDQPRPAVVWQGEQSRVILPHDLRPGQTIVVPAAYGGIGFRNWDPDSDDPVADRAEVAALRYGRRPTLRLHAAVVMGLFGEGTAVPPSPGDTDTEVLRDREVVDSWLEALDTGSAADYARELVDAIRADSKRLIERIALSDDGSEYFIVVARRQAVRSAVGRVASNADAGTTEDTSSFSDREVTLADHLSGVADLVSDLARRSGVPETLAADLRLAAEWHDAGKADPRFQRWLHGGSEFKALVQREPLAKGSARQATRAALRRARERAGYPAGGRHELTSLTLMDSGGEALPARACCWPLVEHLVAVHHGYCRPLAPYVPDDQPVEVVFRRNGFTCKAASAHTLARLDSGIADRFWEMVRRYGWWGLAWLETILRLADHRQSETEQSRG